MTVSFEKTTPLPNEICPICWNELDQNAEVLAHNFTDANGRNRLIHHFHEPCITQHFNLRNDCPACMRAAVLPTTEDERRAKIALKTAFAIIALSASMGSILAMATFGINEPRLRQFTPAGALIGLMMPGFPAALIGGGISLCFSERNAEKASNHMLLAAVSCAVVCAVIFEFASF